MRDTGSSPCSGQASAWMNTSLTPDPCSGAWYPDLLTPFFKGAVFCLFNFDDSVKLSFGLLVLASSDPSSPSFGCFIVYPLARAQKDSHGFDNLYPPMNLGCLHLRDIHNQWKYEHLLKEAYRLACALVISIVDKVIKLLRLKWYCLDSS